MFNFGVLDLFFALLVADLLRGCY